MQQVITAALGYFGAAGCSAAVQTRPHRCSANTPASLKRKHACSTAARSTSNFKNCSANCAAPQLEKGAHPWLLHCPEWPCKILRSLPVSHLSAPWNTSTSTQAPVPLPGIMFDELAMSVSQVLSNWHRLAGLGLKSSDMSWPLNKK